MYVFSIISDVLSKPSDYSTQYTRKGFKYIFIVFFDYILNRFCHFHYTISSTSSNEGVLHARDKHIIILIPKKNYNARENLFIFFFTSTIHTYGKNVLVKVFFYIKENLRHCTHN